MVDSFVHFRCGRSLCVPCRHVGCQRWIVSAFSFDDRYFNFDRNGNNRRPINESTPISTRKTQYEREKQNEQRIPPLITDRLTMILQTCLDEDLHDQRFCSTVMDRSLTDKLIESSLSPLKYPSNFAHNSDWTEGLDFWSLSSPNKKELSTKDGTHRRTIDFHADIGLYLPRQEKPSSAPTSTKFNQIHHKIPSNRLTPERIRLLMRREKDLLLNVSSSSGELRSSQVDLSSEMHRSSLMPVAPSNTFRQSFHLDELRTTDRHDESNQTKTVQSDALKLLLKDHLTSLLNRGQSTMLNQQRTQIEPTPNHENSRNDEQNVKSSKASTQTDISTNKPFQSVSLEKMAQQKTSFVETESLSSQPTNSRPSTQPVHLQISSYQSSSTINQTTQRTLTRKINEAIHSTNLDIAALHENPTTRRVALTNNFHSGNRFSSKTGHNQRVNNPTTTIELLPPIISGKRLHIPLANHRYL